MKRTIAILLTALLLTACLTGRGQTTTSNDTSDKPAEAASAPTEAPSSPEEETAAPTAEPAAEDNAHVTSAELAGQWRATKMLFDDGETRDTKEVHIRVYFLFQEDGGVLYYVGDGGQELGSGESAYRTDGYKIIFPTLFTDEQTLEYDPENDILTGFVAPIGTDRK